ncbi:uncharacterized protein JN550_013361 [Neoarthrinium moseri]|uniref:uncharacterized protein n=1 Tax=Neoarthrinium moseri TaxID=1658444 RepID=UPI001FDD76B5|nr:uncharacterized protein JN550_013361 [Neoarthrinium moseri]KAI1857278.1 hypothetical protein JN550_013361 [Neoarthrinium moseri]
MFSRPSPLAICSSSNLPAFIWPFAPITSTPPCRPIAPAPGSSSGSRLRCRRHTRRYATVHDSSRRTSRATSSSSASSSSVSSSHWPSARNPTPYQIFDQQRDAPYSKARFYELVKVYHPDRHRQVPHDNLTDAARLERYRLVVAANEVLSDPVKRRQYDLYGAGWGSIRSMDSSGYRHADRSWRNEPGNPSMNATWEDWERWYGEQAGTGRRQQTVFMSNELFVVVLCIFVVAGSMTQARRATTTTMNVVEMRDQRHEAITHDMAKRRTEQGGLSRNERVESFLRQREGWNVPDSAASHEAHRTSHSHR